MALVKADNLTKFKAHALRYWLAMNIAGFDAGIQSISAFYGAAGVHTIFDAVPAFSPKQMIGVFVLAFGRAILSYLKAHPIQDVIDDLLDSQNPAPTPIPTPIPAPAPVPAPEPVAQTDTKQS